MTTMTDITSPPSLLLLTGAVFALAGVVKGIVGLGLPTVAMALLALWMSPAHAAALLIVPSLATNAWQIGPWRPAWPLFKRLAPMQGGVVAGTLAGAWWLGAPAGAWANVSLGVALVAYAVWGLAGRHPQVGRRTERWLGPLVGAGTGFVTAATGVFAVPAVPYLQALALQRDDLIQAMGISFTVSTIALAGGLVLNGRYSGADLGASMAMLLPALAGMAAGTVLRRKLSPALFRRCFLISLVLLGTYMVVHEALKPQSVSSTFQQSLA